MTEHKYELTLLALGLFVFAALLALHAAMFRPVQALPVTAATPGTSSKPPQSLPVPSASAEKINLNTAGEQELMTLPGIGETRAQAILEYRAENGLFRSLEELEQVPGIGSALLARLRDHVTLE